MIWKTLNQILNKSNKNSKVVKSFVGNVSSDIIDDPKDIANRSRFNDYFTSISPNLANKIINNNNDAFEKFLSGSHLASFVPDVITQNELETEHFNMKSNKSAGYDEISAKIIKITAKELSIPLTHCFSDSLKIALLTPIFNGNEQNKFENYRPISVLSCFSKLL